MGFVLTKRRQEIILRISAGSPSRLGVAFADRMGSSIATVLAIGDMWNVRLRGVVRCRVEDGRATTGRFDKLPGHCERLP